MKFAKFLVCAVGVLAFALPVIAQVPTGTLSGRVDDGTASLPGVLVTITSPALQGTKTATTSVNGDYIFNFLPPGEYTVRFELAQFQTQETTVKINAAQTQTLNATLPQATVAERVTVTGSYETISSSNQAAATMTREMFNKLPIVAGTAVNFAALAPGTTTTGPGQAITISGAQSWENLFMVNGVNIQDNVRLTPTDNLYIEDAIQETTTQTAAVSAEYGRFAGGVVNMLTKSGGNEMHGSFRLGLDTGDRGGQWSQREPNRVGDLNDTINKTYMATLGGYVLRDKLWYFLGYRNQKLETGTQTYVTNLPYKTVNDTQRYEAKLTFSITANHRLIGSYNQVDQAQDGNSFQRVMDYASLVNRTLPQSLISGNYTGVLSDNFFIEAQYSKKEFAFENSGSKYRDLINGTLMIDYWRAGSSAYRWWSPTFCGVCDVERRDNEEWLAKGSWFLSTAGLGTHDIVFGYDTFQDVRYSNNYQSGSDWRIYGYSIARGDTVYPRMLADGSVWFLWTPIFETSQGTNFNTNSFFVNDKWRLNNNLSFNIGVRYDKNDGKDASGTLVAKDSKISPRLGVVWDLKGDGEWMVNASYGTYVTAIAGGVADIGAGGNPASITYDYYGPEINKDPNAATLVDTATAIQIMFDWLDSVGGTGAADYISGAYLPGQTGFIKGSLDSPSADEMTVGFTKRFGNRAMVRLDYVNRTFHDFYVNQTDMTTGTAEVEFEGTTYLFDKTYTTNDDTVLERKYNGVQFQFQWRPLDPLNIGGNYTYSKAEGNFVGETSGSGPVASGVFAYPEYFERRWNLSYGALPIDQTHKGRLWVVWDAINAKHNKLSVSLLQSYFSGQPYGAYGTIATRPYVTNPGYQTTPSSVGYWFTPRDAFRTDNISRTDLAFNYAFVLPALGTNIEFFVEPKVVNVFNAQGIEVPTIAATGYSTTYTARNSGRGLKAFNPFTDTPVECTQIDTSVSGGKCTTTGANWMKATNFGQPTGPTDYQQPRTFYVSFGIRF
jgi:hypothetical protein